MIVGVSDVREGQMENRAKTRENRAKTIQYN